jgi:hypothetical protein
VEEEREKREVNSGGARGSGMGGGSLESAKAAASRVVEPTSRLSTAMHLKPPQAKLSPRFALNSDSPPVPCAFTSIILPGVRANANATTHIIIRARNDDR